MCSVPSKRRAAVCAALFAALLPTVTTARIVQTSEPLRLGGGIAAPRKVKDVRAVYPADAQRARIQGVVVLEVTIGPDGKVRDAKVLSSIPLLDQAAIDAVRQWEYTPTVVNGAAVPIVMTVTVNFAMQPPGGVAAPAPPPTVRLMATGRPGGVQTVWEIASDRAAAQPRWDPRSAPPSLSIAAAAATASAWLQDRNKDVGPLEMESVMLTRTRFPQPDGFWFYQFDFRAQLGSAIRVVVLPDGSVVEPRTDAPTAGAVAPPTTALPAGVYRPGSGVTAPRALKQVSAEYTDEARRARIQGRVTLEFVVLPDGSVDNARVVQSLEPGLDANALKAIRQWLFSPGTKDGQPVPVMVWAEMTFNLK